MNTERVAKIHRQLARLHEELAVELEQGGRGADEWVDQNHAPIPKRKFLALVRDGELKGRKVDSKHVYVRRSEIDTYLDRQANKSPAAKTFLRRAGLTPLHPEPTGPGIYFVFMPHDSIKIGIASSIRGRIAELQVGAPYRLVLLAAIEGDRDIERAFHDRFLRYRLNGEWFRASDELVAAIRAMRHADVVTPTMIAELVAGGPMEPTARRVQ